MDPALQQEVIRDNINLSHSRAKLAYDKGHYDGVKFDLEEVVVMLTAPITRKVTILQTKYRVTPMQIIEV